MDGHLSGIARVSRNWTAKVDKLPAECAARIEDARKAGCAAKRRK